MEHAIYVCGVGGQGIQLIAKALALAAMNEGCFVMLNGFYGFEMRGGISRSTVVIGDAPLRSLPVAASVDAAIVLHADYWDQSLPRVRDGALVLADAGVLPDLPAMPGREALAVPAAEIAREIGNPMVTGMALIAAFCGIAGLAGRDSLIGAMKSIVPEYRKQHVAANEQAILRGYEAAAALHRPLPLAPIVERALA
jgi:Pyruvate/2-oxoacid:ferredoxin oxidoreductase gamma subunit